MGQSTSKSARTYYYNPNGRQTFPDDSFSLIQKMPSTVRTQQEWLQAQSQARLAAQPRVGPFSQLDAPVVSSLDPHELTQNPLDPFQDNVLYMLSTFRNRNSNTDPRGQPALDPNWQVGTDQLVQIRNVARLDAHGNNGSGITGCNEPYAPKY